MADDFFRYKPFFARPVEDTKVFTGKVFDMESWWELRRYLLNNGHSNSADKNTRIQVSSVKKIQKEIRFWIIKGKIITASQYRFGNIVSYDDLVEPDAFDFCQQMVNIFNLTMHL